mgnify:CR=1 FL=1
MPFGLICFIARMTRCSIFDLARVIEHTREIPSFMFQYGHARGMSVFTTRAKRCRTFLRRLRHAGAYLRQAPVDRLSDTGGSRCCGGWRSIPASSKAQQRPMSLTGLRSIYMN